MKLKEIIFFIAIVLLFSNCHKDSKGCWQAFDPLGSDVKGLIVCDKTKAEAEAAYPHFWFYKQGEQKYCWKVIGRDTFYTWGIPESMAEKIIQNNGAYHFIKINCNSFCSVEWYEKHKSKITNEYKPTLVFNETLLSPDSCSKLSVGQVIVIRETPDSLITRELVNKNP